MIAMESLETRNGVPYARIYCMQLRPEVRRQLSWVLSGRCMRLRKRKHVHFNPVVRVRYVPRQNKGRKPRRGSRGVTRN